MKRWIVIAWFAADAAAVANKGSTTSLAVAGASSTIAAQNYYLEVTAQPVAPVQMTSSDGVVYAVVNGKLAKAAQTGTTTSTLELSYKWYNMKSGEGKAEISEAEVNTIAASSSRFKFTIGTPSSTRVRLGTSATISAQTLGGSVDIYADIAANGVVTFKKALTGDTAADTIYFSVAGQLAVDGDSSKTGGTGLVAGNDLSSTFLDENYLGKPVTADDDGSTVSGFNSANAAGLLKVTITPEA